MKQRINIILMTLVMFFTMSNFTLKADTNDNVQYYKAYQYTQKMSYESDLMIGRQSIFQLHSI